MVRESSQEEVSKLKNDLALLRRKYNDIFDRIGDGIIEISTKGRLIDCNKAALSMLGFAKKEEIVGKRVTKCFRKRKDFFILRREILAKRKISGKRLNMVKVDGEKIVIDLTAKVLKGENGKDIVKGIFKDVTESEQCLSGLTEMKEGLEELVREKTSSLEISRKRYRSLFENAGYPVVLVDIVKNTILDVNTTFKRVFGYKFEELSKKKCGSLCFSKKDAVKVRDCLKKTLMEGRSSLQKIECVRKSGSSFLAEVDMKKIVFDKNEGVVMIVLRDVTDFVKLEEKLKKSEAKAYALSEYQRSILNSVSEGIYTIDKDFIIRDWSLGFLNINGFSKKDVVGKDARKVFSHWATTGRKSEYEKIFREGQVFSGEVTKMHEKRKEIVNLSYNTGPLRDSSGKIIGAVTVVRDITKEKRLDRMRDSFIAVASHQMRTPLSAVQWFLDMLIDGDYGKLDGEQLDVVKKAHRSNKRMIELVNSMLDLSQIEGGRMKLNFETVNIRNIAKRALDDLNNFSEERGVKIISRLEKRIPLVKLDNKALYHIFHNLVENAVKYSNPGDKVNVTVRKIDSKQRVVFSVRNRGVLIKMEERDQLFERFYRGEEAMTIDGRGTGLGLYVVKYLVDNLGGRVWCDCGKANVFNVSFPLDINKCELN